MDRKVKRVRYARPLVCGLLDSGVNGIVEGRPALAAQRRGTHDKWSTIREKREIGGELPFGRCVDWRARGGWVKTLLTAASTNGVSADERVALVTCTAP